MTIEQKPAGRAAQTPRERFLLALQHQEPDRVPVDFLAAPEVWRKLEAHFKDEVEAVDSGGYFDPLQEGILRRLEVDARLISYDMFCKPPESVLKPGAVIDWWRSHARSTPNRMWRQFLPDGSSCDIWGHHTRVVENPTGQYEEYIHWPLKAAISVDDLRSYPWPQPDWWDFSDLGAALAKLNPQGAYSMRFRAGTIFESSWQLRGMETFLTDLALNPDMAQYIMERQAETIVENTRRVLELAGEAIDIVYFYDDVGAQNGLMISKRMWQRFIRPLHQRIIDTAHAFGKQVMYHCDGAIYSLLNDLVEMGVDILNPVQPTARDMAPARLKAEFGDRLAFHGGIDIVGTLPHGSPQDVRDEVRQRVQEMGENGGYILASSHHIQSDTPLENVLAMYEIDLRYRK